MDTLLVTVEAWLLLKAVLLLVTVEMKMLIPIKAALNSMILASDKGGW